MVSAPPAFYTYHYYVHRIMYECGERRHHKNGDIIFISPAEVAAVCELNGEVHRSAHEHLLHCRLRGL